MNVNARQLQRMMQQAQKIQEDLAAAQSQLAARTFEGSAGGAAVVVRMTGDGEVVSVQIDPGVIDPEEPELLADLVMAAFKQARQELREAAEAEMGSLGLGLPFG